MTRPPDDHLDREVLAAYEVPTMASDLADRFVDQLRAHERAAPALRASWRRPAAAVTLLAAGLAAGLLFGRPGGAPRREPGPERGSIAAGARREVRLADRAIAVAEAGAEVSWRHGEGGGLSVGQARGEVFYRVEPGGPLEVDTPAGQVRVTGTCFRVAVTSPQGVAGHAAVAVSVDEGSVVLTAGGQSLSLGAGERGVADGGAPVRAPRIGSSPPGPRDAAGPDRDELSRRVAALEDEVRRLRGPDGTGTTGQRPLDLRPEELVAMARRCDVPFDLPPTRGSSIMDEILARGFDKAAMTEAERRAVERVIARTQPAYEQALRSIYAEVTGEGGEALDPISLVMEVIQKAPPGEVAAAKRRVGEERAGLRAPPADPDAGTPLERQLRLGIRAGDAFERELVREMPADRARAFRRTWGGVNLGPGCDGADSDRGR